MGSLHFDVPGFSQSLHCFGVCARHSEVCGLRTGDKPLLSPLRGSGPIQATPYIPLFTAHFSSQPQSHQLSSSFVLFPYTGLQTSPFTILYSHSAIDLLGDLLDVWIRARETSCLTLPKPLNFFVSVCKPSN